MAAATPHPTNETLRANGLGKLDDHEAEAVSRHLDDCPDCQSQVAGLSSDSFPGRLRQGKSTDSEGAERTTPVGSSLVGRPGQDATRTPAVGFPIELLNHPDYEIVRELSGGGMGRVFLAHNNIMGRDEVLKLIGPHIIDRPGVRDRFIREIRAVAQLRHTNIVTAYAAFHAGASLVFAMEYVDGLDLARMVKAKGAMPVGHACYFVQQAALGLQHAHEAGMVHRDIKPGNLMLSHEGGRAAIKVLDFGLAKAGREQGLLELSPAGTDGGLKAVKDLTLAGQMLGTPDFIAPEQITDAQGADIRADIYSLGCTLYYLLTGRPPFRATNLADLLQAHHSMDALPLNLARPEVPAELAALVAKMMAKKPHRRFQTPADAARALSPFFKKRSTGSVRPNLGVDPAVAPDAGPAPVGPTELGTNTVAGFVPNLAAEPVRGMWSSLIEFSETSGNSVEVSAAPSPVEKRPRWFRFAVGAVAGFAAILLAVIIILVTNGRTRSARDQSRRDAPTQTARTQAATERTGGGLEVKGHTNAGTEIPEPGGTAASSGSYAGHGLEPNIGRKETRVDVTPTATDVATMKPLAPAETENRFPEGRAGVARDRHDRCARSGDSGASNPRRAACPLRGSGSGPLRLAG